MKQFLLKEGPDRDGLVRLYDEDYHYLVHVRRLKPGSVFTALLPGSINALDHAGKKATITVRTIEKHILTGAVSSANSIASSLELPFLPPIVLFQALPKGTKMDMIVRQAAEMGISEVVPFISEYSIPKENTGSIRTERWRRIVKEARQQSGSAIDTRIHETLSLNELFTYWKKLQSAKPAEALGLVFCPWPAMVYSSEPQNSQSVVCGDGSPLDGGEEIALDGVFAKQKLQVSKTAKQALNTRPLAQGGFHRYLYKKPSLLVLMTGPEGGFSGAELKRFTNEGFKALSLGDAVLRTETAAICGMAAVKITLMERECWTLKLQ